MKVAVVIPTFNRKEYLKKLLDQIRVQDINNVIIMPIVVVDGSTDGTSEMLLNKYPEVIIVHGTGNWWFTKCLNEGCKKAIELQVDYVLVLNDDTEIRPNYIMTLWADFQTLPQEAILGSASISMEPKDLIDFSGTKSLKTWLMKKTPYFPNLTPIFPEFKGIHPTWTMNGRGSFIPISVFNKIGLFDENLIQYGSDDEFALRARKSGLPVFISWNAKVYNHLLMTSEGTTFRKDSFGKFLKSFINPYSVNSIKKTFYIYKKHWIKPLASLYIIYVFFGTLKAYLFKYRKMKKMFL